MAKNRSAGKLHASCDTRRTPNKQGAWKILTFSLQYVWSLVSMLCVCVCIYILWVSPKHVFHPLLPFSPKLEFYKVIFLTAGDHKNYLAVHKGWPLKWKLVTTNTKECNRITLNRIESLLTEMSPRERAFSAPIYVFYDFFVNADSLFVLCHFGKKESTVNHGKTKQCCVQFQCYFWWHFFWPLWNTYWTSSLLSLGVTRFSAKHILFQVNPSKGIRRCYTP